MSRFLLVVATLLGKNRAKTPRRLSEMLAKQKGNMPKKLTEIETRNAYLNGVMERADHHAHKVREVALALVGATI